MLEGFGSDYGSSLKGSVEPQMKSIVGYTGEQDEAATNDGEVSPWTTKVLSHSIVLSPYFLNNHRCECVCAKYEKGEAGQDACKGVLVCGLVEKIISIKVGECNKIIEEHIEEGAFALPGTMLKAWAKAEDKDGKDDIFLLCHCTVMPGGIIKLGAPLWFAAVTDGHCSGADGKLLGVKDVALMKIKVLV
jgi:hypothetical protein